jgi:uroporphyrinogen-III synthase
VSNRQPTVLVTRPSGQSEGLCKRILDAGFKPIRFPTIEIVDIKNPASARESLTHLSHHHYIIFTSVNAVTYADKTLNGQWQTGDSKLVAIGPRTRQALKRKGLSADITAEPPFSSEQLLSNFPPTLEGKNCLILKGEEGRTFLSSSLRQRGANVQAIDVYRRTLPQGNTAFPTEHLDFVTVTSQLSLENFFALCPINSQEFKENTCFVVFSERLANAVRTMGCKLILVSEQASDESLVSTIVQAQN